MKSCTCKTSLIYVGVKRIWIQHIILFKASTDIWKNSSIREFSVLGLRTIFTFLCVPPISKGINFRSTLFDTHGLGRDVGRSIMQIPFQAKTMFKQLLLVKTLRIIVTTLVNYLACNQYRVSLATYLHLYALLIHKEINFRSAWVKLDRFSYKYLTNGDRCKLCGMNDDLWSFLNCNPIIIYYP